MKKVVMVAWSTVTQYPPVVNMALHLASNGYRVRMHCLGPEATEQPAWASGSIVLVRYGEHSHNGFEMYRIVRRMSKAIREDVKDANCLVLHSFQSFAIWAFIRFAGVTCPVLYCAHEFSPASTSTLLHRVPKIYERRLARYCVVTVPDPWRVPLHHFELGLTDIPYVVRNCPLLRKEIPNTSTHSLDERFAPGDMSPVGYCGRISPVTGIPMMIDAFKRHAGRFHLHLLGPIDPSFLHEFDVAIRAAGPNVVTYHGCVPYDHVEVFLSHCDYGILFYDGHSLNTAYCAPGKLFEYISRGLPVLASPLPGLRDVIESRHLGWCFPSNDLDGIDAVLKECKSGPEVATMRQFCIDAHRQEYNYEAQLAPVLRHLHI